ncbi:MAG: MerR family DNA-binding protein [Gammaproteobacteria bacterium]|nr:MerR family DNA-binding protein [Gammaproteobacteria bacterium]MDH3464520.1 MerR family DNA-binding protein [Gammaproteobacteria bacterium]
MNTLTRGQLARLCKVGAEAIRFYERQGLLPPPARSASGYRRYTQDAVDRINFICRAKQLGFNLKEIRELLELQDDPHRDRSDVKAITESKLAEISGKIRDLESMRTVLNGLVAECSGSGPIAGCPIIDALARDMPLAMTAINRSDDDTVPSSVRRRG